MDDRSPLLIQIMLVCHISAAPRETMGAKVWDSPAAVRARQRLRQEELIYEDGSVTARGRAWVSCIVDTPLPDRCWVLKARGRVVVVDGECVEEVPDPSARGGKVIGEGAAA